MGFTSPIVRQFWQLRQAGSQVSPEAGEFLFWWLSEAAPSLDSARRVLGHSADTISGLVDELASIGLELPKAKTRDQVEGETPDWIEEILFAFPRKSGLHFSRKAIKTAIMRGYDPKFLLHRTRLYAKAVSGWPIQERKYVLGAQAFFGDLRFLQDEEAWHHKDTPEGVTPVSRRAYPSKSTLSNYEYVTSAF